MPLIKHQFVKRLHTRFTAAGCVIPFPVRTVACRTATSGAEAQRTAGAA
jgi:hypothetical protein